MKKRINSVLNRASITRKIIIIFIGSTLLPVSFIMAYYYIQTTNETQTKILTSLESSLSSSASELDSMLESAVQLSILYNREDIIDFLDTNYISEYEYIIAHQETFYNYFGFDLLFYEQVDDINYYTNNTSILSGKIVSNEKKMSIVSEDNVSQISTSLNFDNSISLIAEKNDVLTDLDSKYQYTIVHEINTDGYADNFEADVNIELNTSFVLEILNSTTSLFSSVVLVDDNSSVLAASSLGNYEFGSVFNEFTENSGNVVIEKIGNYPMYICGIYDSDIISVAFINHIFELIVYFSLAIVFSLVFIFLVGNNISDRAKEIVKHSNEIAKGNFDYNSKLDPYAIDEIGTVERSLIYLNSQIKELIINEKNLLVSQVELEKQNSEAKMLALQSQVNPHFLFNSLESIRLKAIAKKEVETATMIKYMAKMFRHIIEWEEEMIPIYEEVNFLYEYLSIQKYRFGDKLSYDISVEDKAKSYLIPKMLIQPLVENACAHGAETVSRDTFIKVSIFIIEEKVHVLVKDDGAGIEEDKLMQIKSMLSGESKMRRSIGLSNVYQRLKLFFNGKCQMEVDSEFKKGTVCKLILPIIERSGEDV